jgi:hypothetical protein
VDATGISYQPFGLALVMMIRPLVVGAKFDAAHSALRIPFSSRDGITLATIRTAIRLRY